MDNLLQQFESLVTEHLSAFAAFLAEEHDLVMADVEKSLQTFISAVTKTSGTDPKTVATKISTLSKGEENSESSDDQEIKTRILGDEEVTTGEKSKKLVITDEDEEGTTTVDSESEDAPPPKKGKSVPTVEDSSSSEEVVVASEDSEEEEEEEEEVVPPPKKGKAKPEPKKGKAKPVEVVVESEDESEEVVEESEEESLPPPKKGKAPTKKGKVVKPTPVDDDEDESEPKPKKGKKAAEPKEEGEMELSDTPKLPVKDRPAKMPKGIKFLKGTNNIVHGGVVVASLSKKGIGKLTNVNIKPLESKGIEYQVWDDAKIKKTFK